MRENDNISIETIDLIKRTGSVDLSLFYDLNRHLQFQAEVCDETRRMISDVMQDIITDVGLEDIDFKPHEVSRFQNGMATADGKIHGITMIGMDSKYQYIVSIVTEFDFENDTDDEDDEDYEDFSLEDDEDINILSDDEELKIAYAENVQVSLVKIGLNADNDYYRYDFSKKAWHIINYKELAEASGYTAKQLAMVEKGKDMIKIHALETYKNEFGAISDDDFELLLNNNRAILDLYKRTCRFTDLFLLDENKFAIAPAALVDGGFVECINDVLQLNASFFDATIRVVKETAKISEMTKTIKFLFDRYIPEDTIAIVPISAKNYAMIFASGGIEVARSMSRDEELVLKTYMQYSGLVSDEEE